MNSNSIMKKLIFLIWHVLLVQFSIAQQSVFDAIMQNDLALVQQLVNNGADVNSRDKDGDCALMLATVYGSAEMVRFLLEEGADPDLKNHEDETALMWAAHDLEKVKLLVKYGAGVNEKAKSGNTPLLMACIGNDQLDIIRFLVSEGADPLARNEKQETALIRAAIFGDTATISYLIAKGNDVNAMDERKFTPLIQSIFNVNRPATLFLLERGADPDLVAVFGLTAIIAVVTYNDLPSVNAILKKTKNINAVDEGGYSALMWAAYNEHDNPEIIQSLIENGAHVNYKAKDGSTALSWARKKGNTKTLQLLLKAEGL